MALTRRSGNRPVVTRLLATAVKGCAVVEHARLRLGPDGAEGDRDLFLVDADGRLFSISRSGALARWTAELDDRSGVLTLRGIDGRVLTGEVVTGEAVTVDFWGSREVTGRVVGGPWPAWLSEIAGRPVALVRPDLPGTAFDETPVTLLSEESVAEVARIAGAGPIDLRRFRMSVNLAGVQPYAEESWRDRTVRAGSALLRVHGPVPRCGATTRNPVDGRRDLKTLRLLDRARGPQPSDFGRGLNLGVYAEVLEPGVVAVGDTLELG